MHAIFALLLAVAAPINGTWSIAPADSGRIHYEVRFVGADGSTHSENSSDVDPSSIGISLAQLDGPSSHVTFAQTHDAGTFAFDGEVAHRAGGGTVVFTPNEQYVSAMRAKGYDDVTPSQQLAAAMLDISLAYAGAIAATGLTPHPSMRDLISFRALKIDDAYVRSMRAAFPNETVDPRDIVSLKALGVTSDYLSQLRASGLTASTPHAAVELRALKIDGTYVHEIAESGFPNLTPRELIEFKALGIDADFIKRVRDHGFNNLSVRQLVELKVMHVI